MKAPGSFTCSITSMRRTTSKRSLCGQLLSGGDTVVDGQRLGSGVYGGGLDILLGGINADDVGAKPCHGLRQQTAAAADVEEAQTRKGPALERIERKAGGDLLA